MLLLMSAACELPAHRNAEPLPHDPGDNVIARNMVLRRLAAFVCATAALASTHAVAAYPDKPVRLVVPFAPGGGTDLVARTLAVGMGKELGQQLIIDNKPR